MKPFEVIVIGCCFCDEAIPNPKNECGLWVWKGDPDEGQQYWAHAACVEAKMHQTYGMALLWKEDEPT